MVAGASGGVGLQQEDEDCYRGWEVVVVAVPMAVLGCNRKRM